MNIFLVINYGTGGVVQYNVLLYKFLKLQNKKVKFICLKQSHQNPKEFISQHEIDEIDIFFFEQNNYENLNHVSNRFKSFLTNQKVDLLITSDSLELLMIQLAKISIRTYFILHGDYDHYYNTASSNENIIDLLIGVSNNIVENCKKIIPNLESIVLYPLVEPLNKKAQKSNSIVTITFIGRPTKSKGYHIVQEMIRKAQEIEGIKFQWNIILGEYFKEDTYYPNVQYFYNIKNHLVREILLSSDFFILPSEAEGFPISLVEAIYAENICVTSDLPIFNEFLIENNLGFVVNSKNYIDYLNVISNLVRDEKMFSFYKEKINNFSCQNLLYDNENLSKLTREENSVPLRKFIQPKVGRLDRKIFPNFVTRIYRKSCLSIR
jgi:glycosyltransferase involved in cell wall biosynthesis